MLRRLQRDKGSPLPDATPHDGNHDGQAAAQQPMKAQESVADFKQRIAIIMRERETGKKYSIIGAARPPEWCRKKDLTTPKPDGIIQHD